MPPRPLKTTAAASLPPLERFSEVEAPKRGNPWESYHVFPLRRSRILT